MQNQQIKKIILEELPRILKEDPEVQDLILRLSREHFADKVEMESRFDRLLEELRRDREEQKAWREEQSRKWEEQNRRWAEQSRKWEEQNKKWEENQQVIRQMLKKLETLDRKFESTLGALGARWGLYTEESFRSALKGILEEFFDVKVISVTEYDHDGEVFFGRPEQIELDLIIKNDVLIICEIKSSMSKADMYLFERKARFYEKRHNRKAHKLIVISPMVDNKARKVAEKLGIEIYSYAEDAGEMLA